MSLCYHIVCRDCRVEVWIGQDKLERFLFAHYMHTLTFMETNDVSDLQVLWEKTKGEQ